MALRIETRTGAFLAGLLLAPALFAQQSFRYEVRQRRVNIPFRSQAAGTLTIDHTGVSFKEADKSGKAPQHPLAWHWGYHDIQQLKIAPNTLAVLTYKDNKWKLGADREYNFDVTSGKTFEDAYAFLKNILDQRFVAAIPEAPASPLWEIPAKHRVRLGGDEGVLKVGAGEIAYESEKKGESRTWRYEDIDNIASSGPFDLTITTFERARRDYAGRKQFNFELKQRLDEARYNDLWLRLNQSKGLTVLQASSSEPKTK